MILTKKKLPIIRPEYIFPLLAAASLLISCILISNKKYFWNDELYSYYLLADQSFVHMLTAFHDKINNTPFLYFLIGWLWTRIFGSSELSLRIFSSLGCCIASLAVWITLRRTYSLIPTSIGVFTVFCTSNLILYQNSEARMYGLFLAVCSFGLLQYDLLNRNIKSTRRSLFLNVCIHAAIIHTHLFGLFYSGAILLAQIVGDFYRKIFKFEIYTSIALGMLSIIFYIPSFLNQADVGKPRTWLPIPGFKDLTDFLGLTSSPFFNTLIFILLVTVTGLQFILYSKKESDDPQKHMNHQEKLYLLLLAYCFLFVPVIVWTISRTIKPIFIDRYMIPTAIGWSILLTHFCSHILQTNTPVGLSGASTLYAVFRSTKRQILLLLLFIYLLLYPIKFSISYDSQSRWGLDDNKYGYQDLPIVLQFSGRFMPTFHYSSNRERYFFILDWQAAVDENSGSFSPQEYKHLDAFRRIYPELFQKNIVASEDFLEKHSRFLVVSDNLNTGENCPLQVIGLEKYNKWEDFQCPQWLKREILSNPKYKVKSIGTQPIEKIFLVEKQL